MKAKEKHGTSNLPATLESTRPMALQSILSYVSKKLTLKELPAPEKTIKAFPLRTAFSALCSALLICTLMFSFGALSGIMPTSGEGGGYIAAAEENSPEENEEYEALGEKN